MGQETCSDIGNEKAAAGPLGSNRRVKGANTDRRNQYR